MKLYTAIELHRMPHKELEHAYLELASKVATPKELETLVQINHAEDPFHDPFEDLSVVDRINLWLAGRSYK